VNEPTRIALRNMRAYGRHGASASERERLQPFDLEVEIEADLTAARRSDVLEDTIDYAALHERIVGLVANSSFALLERLGQHILDDLLGDARIVCARVTIAKPGSLGGATPAVTVSAARGR
jgi:7,8-dihydroneopterin aldolase/epimerase/oxygenase